MPLSIENYDPHYNYCHLELGYDYESYSINLIRVSPADLTGETDLVALFTLYPAIDQVYMKCGRDIEEIDLARTIELVATLPNLMFLSLSPSYDVEQPTIHGQLLADSLAKLSRIECELVIQMNLQTINAIANGIAVDKLTIFHNTIIYDNIQALTRANINTLHLSSCDIEDTYRLPFANLTSLALHNCNINNSDLGFIGHILSTNSTLTKLDLDSNRISDFGIQKFMKGLCSNFTLTSLNLGRNGIKSMEFLRDNTTITDLNLDQNCIYDLEFGNISQILVGNSTLLQLSLQEQVTGRHCFDTAMDPTIISRIIQALTINSTLKELDLSNNYFQIRDPEFMVELAHMLAINTSLVGLVIPDGSSYNMTTAIPLLEPSLRINPSLTTLTFQNVEVKILEPYLERNRTNQIKTETLFDKLIKNDSIG